jgi:hypothetical protein
VKEQTPWGVDMTIDSASSHFLHYRCLFYVPPNASYGFFLYGILKKERRQNERKTMKLMFFGPPVA